MGLITPWSGQKPTYKDLNPKWPKIGLLVRLRNAFARPETYV
ncbi:hypothetical protein Lpp221_04452 [Lacticaseibacillus paracasei subsp. paracasei Lpp221]|nr:hypothetical protein Lpp221_04452 [Lacticaseibacillus paracasei subsp. paracasei Lpp221]RWZ64165.1 hypothetical protein EQH89_02620 [Lacticaseibacillus paracasei]